MLEVLLEVPQLGLVNEHLLASAGLHQNMPPSPPGLVPGFGPGLDLDDLLLSVLCLQDELLGGGPPSPSLLYQELGLPWLGGLGGLNHQLLAGLRVSDDDVLPPAVLQELLQLS